MNYLSPSQAPEHDAWGHDPEVKRRDHKDRQAELAKLAVNDSDAFGDVFDRDRTRPAKHRMNKDEVAIATAKKPINYEPAGLHRKEG